MPIPQLQQKSGETQVPAGSLPPVAPGVIRSRTLRLRGALTARQKRVLKIVALIFFLTAPFIVSAALTASLAAAAATAVRRAEAATASLDFPATRAALGEAERAAGGAENALTPWKIFRPVPWIGAQVKAIEHALRAAEQTAAAMNRAVAVGEKVLALLPSVAVSSPTGMVSPTKTMGTLSREEKRAILSELLQAAEAAKEIRSRLLVAEAELEAIDTAALTPALRDALSPLRAKVRAAAASVKPIPTLLAVLPRLFGYPAPKTYLFFLANNSEIRPSAGFFGFYGTVKLSDGEIVALDSDDVYNLDYRAADKVSRPAPSPIATYLGVKKWFLRDANWSPDFAAAALAALTIYDEETAVLGRPPTNADGVIAVTPDVAGELLRLTGPITVDGVTFTPDNLVERLEYQVEFAYAERGAPPTERKHILAHLLEAMLRRLTSLPARQWPAVLDIIERNLVAKQILLYEKDQALQSQLESERWAGRVETSAGDYLLVVNANLGALKTDAVVKRQIRYAVEPTDGGRYRATVAVSYKNTGRFTPLTTRYRTYTRFYAPAGSTYLNASGQLKGDRLTNPGGEAGAVDVGSDLGKTVFGMFTAVEPGETKTLTVSYLLPDSVGDAVRAGRYSLLAQKQSGAAAYPLTLDLAFGKKLGRAAPPEEATEWGDDRYRLTTELDKDRIFEIGF